jgi:hypothetical protein
MKDYHGPLPVTESDLDMAKEHLKDTLKQKKAELKLNLKKIKDHKDAAADATNPKSKSYNEGHIDGHVKDNKTIKKVIAERQNSMNTLGTVKPDRTYDDVRKSKVAIMARKATAGAS